MRFAKVVYRIHLWAGVVLGIQIVLWMLSGVVMSWYHIELVRGEKNAFQTPPPELVARNYPAPGGVIAQMDEPVVSVELRHFQGRPVYEVSGVRTKAIFSAESGELLSPISEKVAREVAAGDFIGEGKIIKVTLLDNPPHEYRREKPVWRADFDDNLNTRIYVSPSTGEVLSRRNDVWRLYDFFWMLHIMDYGERDNFNNPIIRGFSAAGLLFALSGLILLVTRKGRTHLINDLRLVRKKFSRP